MGDYRGSYNHAPEEEVKHLVNSEDYEDWSWMHNTHTDDDTANAAAEGEYYYDDINYEADYSFSSKSSQQASREGATTAGYSHRRVRSASGAHTNSFFEDDQIRSQSSEKEDRTIAKAGNPNPNRKKGLRKSHSDPVYGDNSHETPACARNNSINLVSSWLHDTSVGEHEFEAAQHAPAPPATRPPPRRRLSGADMVARSASLPNPNVLGHYHHYETSPTDVQYNGATLPCDPGAGYPYYPEAQYEDNQLAIYDQYEDKQLSIYDPSVGSAPGSVYRLEEKRLDKALRFMRTGAVGFANVSKTAAVGLRQRSIELKNLAVPVMKPILNAVIEESREQLIGPDRGRGRAYPLQRPSSAELDRMATPYVPALGRGRAPMPRPVQRPPVMRPGMPAGQRPVMRPGVPAGQRPVMRPGMMRPGMPPQGAVPPMATSAARGQGVAMRGQPPPRGRTRPVRPIDSY